jgi:outer membrane protein TolC
MDRTAWAWMPVLALPLFCVEPAPCAAQTPVPQPTSASNGNPASTPVTPGLSPLPSTTTSPVARGFGTSGPGTTETNPLAKIKALRSAPLAPGDLRFPINLATALRLSDARPLVVAAAQASVWVAEADLSHAKVLWVPTLNIGFDYYRHDGGGPDFNKGIMTAPSLNFFYAGAGLTGNGLVGNIPVADAIFEPLVARQVLNSRQWDIQTSKNDALLQTANAYFSVHQARGNYAATLYTVDRGRDLVARIEQLSREFVTKVEVDRARNFLADLEQQAAQARQEWRVQSANLTQVLRLDPRAVVEPLEHDHAQITLIDPGRSLDELMPVALMNRPELESHKALVEAAVATIRREKARFYTPQLLLNGFQTPAELLQAGIFGLGPNNTLNQWRGRDDFSIQPIWQFEACGLGNLARIKGQRARQSQEIIDFWKAQDSVAADVTRASARLESAAARVLQADRGLRTGIITFNGNFEGLQQTSRFGNVLVLATRPQEAVFALQLLIEAFNNYFFTVGDYNRAQFELFHALGYPAKELAVLRTPGPVEPVEINRPGYLPPVGNGPPPATR